MRFTPTLLFTHMCAAGMAVNNSYSVTAQLWLNCNAIRLTEA